MKRIPKKIVLDYLLFSIGIFLLVILLEPFGTRDFKRSTENFYFFYVIEAISFFVFFLLSDLLVSYPFNLPVDYSKPRKYQIKRIASLAIPCILMNSLFDGYFFIVIRWGFGHWNYLWIDQNSHFTLRWYLRDLGESFCMGIFVVSYIIFVTYNRMQKSQIENLKAITVKKPELKEKIMLTGTTHESLLINPTDIIYIESQSNYSNVYYLCNNKVQTSRLRIPLREIAEKLEEYAHIVQIHRAYIVNLQHVTDIDGTSSGYNLKLTSTDTVLSVSRGYANSFKRLMHNISQN